MALLVDRAGHPAKAGKTIDWVGLWILFSTWCTLSGWILSSLGFLNRGGYSVSFLLFFGFLWLFRQPLGFSGRTFIPLRLRIFRSHQWLPKIWLLLAILALVGGLIYHPNNYDYLTYRFSRVLHWCWEQKWHWIITSDERMNLAATGFEWLMGPLFVFFKTDRLFFSINIISFLLLPGLIFSVFHRMGISKRVSWWWMWILPSGYCFLLQAGSASNDLFGSTYLLASFLYIFKAGEKPSAPSTDFFYSSLSIALVTAAKASNLPLVLPWFIAAYMQRTSLLKIKPLVLAGILFIAGCVSFVPNAILNIAYTGSYTGDPQNLTKMRLDSPVAGLIGNSLLLGDANFKPPIWPAQIRFNDVLPPRLREYLDNNFPRLGIHALVLEQVVIEESGGVGVGITASILLMIGLRGWAGIFRPELVGEWKKAILPIMICVWIAVLVTMAKLGSESIPRLIAPYYPLLVASILILVPFDGTLIRFLICRIFAGVIMAVSLFLIVINPARPLFPTQWAATAIAKIAPSRVERLERVYTVYGSRYDAMKDVRVLLPEAEKSVGFIQTGDDLDAPLWLPYGSRKIVDVWPDLTLDQLKAEHLHLIIVDDDAIRKRYSSTMNELLQKWSASIVAKKELDLRASTGPAIWYIIALP